LTYFRSSDEEDTTHTDTNKKQQEVESGSAVSSAAPETAAASATTSSIASSVHDENSKSINKTTTKAVKSKQTRGMLKHSLKTLPCHHRAEFLGKLFYKLDLEHTPASKQDKQGIRKQGKKTY
jgi:hypothetical protein